jgi:hypothetical protein
MNTTNERCSGCTGHGEVPSGYTRFRSGLMAWRVCDECHGSGTVEIEPVFASWDDYSAYDADDLRDAAMDHDADESEVA